MTKRLAGLCMTLALVQGTWTSALETCGLAEGRSAPTLLVAEAGEHVEHQSHAQGGEAESPDSRGAPCGAHDGPACCSAMAGCSVPATTGTISPTLSVVVEPGGNSALRTSAPLNPSDEVATPPPRA